MQSEIQNHVYFFYHFPEKKTSSLQKDESKTTTLIVLKESLDFRFSSYKNKNCLCFALVKVFLLLKK